MRFLLIFCLITPVFAQQKPMTPPAGVVAITQFSDWAVFSGTTPKGKICYAASQPKERLPKDLKRDPAFILIATRPAEKISHEFSMQAGFAMKADVDGTIVVGATTIPMFSKGDGAWVKLPADEPKLLTAMKTGANLVFKATSQRGNALSDSYSLSGLSQALEKAASECK